MTAFTTLADPARLARTAGLRELRLPHLEEVDRRRAQLWSLSLLVALAIPSVIVVMGVIPAEVTGTLDLYSARLVLFAFLVVVLGYVAEREVTLRRLTHSLVHERVLTASLVHRVHELNLLLRATRAMNADMDLPTVLQQISESAHELLSASGVTVLLVPDDDDQVLEVANVIGQDGRGVGYRQPIDEGLAGGAVRTRDALIVTEDDVRTRGHRTVGDVLVAPLEVRGELVGVISVVAGQSRDPFTEFELRGLSVFADAAAGAITNARAYQASERKVATLEERDRARDEFLTLVTHELRTPLTSVIGLLSTLQRHAPRLSAEQVASYADVARNQGWRLDRLIDNLLQSSRLHRGSLEVLPRPAVPDDVVAAAIAGIAEAHPERVLTYRGPAQPHPRIVDIDALARMVDNLVGNALKYSRGGIEVTLAEHGDQVLLAVVDHGDGVRPEDREQIFERFARGADPHNAGGMGLGLFVVRQLVEGHGGTVEVSDTPGGGATFTVTLTAPPAG